MAQLLNIFTKVLGIGTPTLIILLLAVVVCYLKWPKPTGVIIQVVVCLAVFVGVPIFDFYCAVNINGYYGAEGGIFGYIGELAGVNKGKVTTDTFEVYELNLRLDENNEYSATIGVNLDEQTSVLKIDKTKKHVLLVNGALTSDNFMAVTGDSIAMSADYGYSFKGFQKDEIVKDSLHIAFQINKSEIECKLSTQGTSLARDMWRLYYKKNGMKIKFVESDYTKPPISNEGEGDVSGLCSLVFNDGETSVTKICNKNTVFSDVPTVDAAYGYTFAGWSTDGENIFDFSQPINENLQFTPIFTMKPTKWISSGNITASGYWQQYFDADSAHLSSSNTEVIVQEKRLLCQNMPEKFLGIKIHFTHILVDSGLEGTRDIKSDYSAARFGESGYNKLSFWMTNDEVVTFDLYGNSLQVKLEIQVKDDYQIVVLKALNASGKFGHLDCVWMDEIQYLVEA